VLSRTLQLGFFVLRVINLPGENPLGPLPSPLRPDPILPTVTGPHPPGGLYEEKYHEDILDYRIRGIGDSCLDPALAGAPFLHAATEGPAVVGYAARQERGQEACPIHR
jgi:hypothetical protein